MTIENAKVLQERLADEAIAQVQVQGSKELADACIHSIGIVGKAWGMPRIADTSIGALTVGRYCTQESTSSILKTAAVRAGSS